MADGLNKSEEMKTVTICLQNFVIHNSNIQKNYKKKKETQNSYPSLLRKYLVHFCKFWHLFISSVKILYKFSIISLGIERKQFNTNSSVCLRFAPIFDWLKNMAKIFGISKTSKIVGRLLMGHECFIFLGKIRNIETSGVIISLSHLR